MKPTLSQMEAGEAVCPSEYFEFKELFIEKFGGDALLEHKPWDYIILIKEGEALSFGPLYSLSAKEEQALREFLEKYLAKDYIRPFESLAGYPILFIPKKDGKL